MKIKIIFLVLIIINIIGQSSYATEEIVKSELEVLDMSSVVKEGKKYTNEIFPEIDIEKSLSEITRGNINNKAIANGILKVFGKEIVNSVTLLGSILAIIVIHSILKNIGENLGNENVAKIAYYVEYILIVTLITANFSQIVDSIKNSINNLSRIYELFTSNIISINQCNWTSNNNNSNSASAIIYGSNNRKPCKYCNFANRGNINSIGYNL